MKRGLSTMCAGAAIAGGLAVVSGPAQAEPTTTPTGTAPRAASAAADATTHPTTPIDGVYRSRPDLTRPLDGGRLKPTASTELFFGEQRGKNSLGSYATTAFVYDRTGTPVWIGPGVSPSGPYGARAITYDGRPAFAFYDSAVRNWTIVDTAYNRLATVPVTAESTQYSPIFVTNGDGTRALVSGNRVVAADLTAQGGPADGRVVVPVVREIELASGATLFTWDSWADGPGHIPLTDSVPKLYGPEAAYVNVTGLAYDTDGGILVGAHTTRAVYKISRSDGSITWTLGGKRGDLTLASDTAVPVGPAALYPDADGTLWILDETPNDRTNTLKAYRIDEAARTVTQTVLPSMTVWRPIGDGAPPAANVQRLDSGNMFASVMGGSSAEFDSSGTLLAEAFGASVLATPVRAEWHSRPTTKPDVALDMTSPTNLSTYVSWNGATDVASWRVSVGPDAAHLRPLTTGARAGFETRVDGEITAADAVARVEALDASGAVLGTSADTPLSPITRKYGEFGGPTSALGRPTSLIEPWMGGYRQHFGGGDIYWRAETGAHVVVGEMAVQLDGLGSAGGFPTSDATPTPDGQGSYQLTTTCVWYGWSTPTPVVPVCGLERAKYSALQSERGPLGYPIDAFVTVDPATGNGYQRFQGGRIYRHGGPTSPYDVEMHGAIYQLWLAQQGEYGPAPLTDELTTPDGVGRYTHFVGDWSIYWTPSTGAKSVRGGYRAKWAASGWERGIGYPTTEQLPLPSWSGQNYQHFQAGSLYPDARGNGELHIVKGAIRDEWARTGWENGPLHLPGTDEMATPDGYGRYNQFTFGCIYWTPRTGAHALNYHAREMWSQIGWERGFLGYPTTSTARTPDGVGEFTHFEGGSLYWSAKVHPDGTTWVTTGSVRGDIRAKWASLGWERSRLGYPQGNESAWGDGTVQQNFEHGYILWKASTRTTTVHYY